MYFWRIEKLKTSMAAAPLTEREVLPYLVASIIAIYIALGLTQHTPITSFWDDISSFCEMLFAVIGTIYIYRKNNGKNGQHFLQRYIAINWVVSVRMFVGALITYYILQEILSAVYVNEENSALIDFIYFFIINVILYWRIGHHVHDLAQKNMTQENI